MYMNICMVYTLRNKRIGYEGRNKEWSFAILKIKGKCRILL